MGSSIAFSLIQKGLFSELVLLDVDWDKAEGEAMDLSHGLPYIAAMDVYAGTYDDVADCALIILTAGASQKPGGGKRPPLMSRKSFMGSRKPSLT